MLNAPKDWRKKKKIPRRQVTNIGTTKEKAAVGDKRSAPDAPDAPDSDFKAPVVIGHTQDNESLAAQGAQAQQSTEIIEESQPVKNRNLNRLLANLSRLNWSSQRSCVYCFSTVFTLLQHQEVLV
jgi:hypothetical protein